jgi:hypothetical protein
MTSFRPRPINCQRQRWRDSETVSPRGILNAVENRNIAGKLSSTLPFPIWPFDECFVPTRDKRGPAWQVHELTHEQACITITVHDEQKLKNLATSEMSPTEVTSTRRTAPFKKEATGSLLRYSQNHKHGAARVEPPGPLLW